MKTENGNGTLPAVKFDYTITRRRMLTTPAPFLSLAHRDVLQGEDSAAAARAPILTVNTSYWNDTARGDGRPKSLILINRIALGSRGSGLRCDSFTGDRASIDTIRRPCIDLDQNRESRSLQFRPRFASPPL